MRRVWPALVVVNVAWSVHLVVSYYLAWAACAGDDGWLAALRHLATVVALGLALAALWQGRQAASATAADAGGGGEWVAEHRFLAQLTVVLGAVLVFAIVLAGAANLVLAPCA